MRFILASQSPARLALLRTAGLDPVVRVSGVDEDAVAASLDNPKPSEVVAALAAAKAKAVVPTVATEFTEAVIVACDTMLVLQDATGSIVVGKPASEAEARQRWAQMAGNSGELLTGHTVLRLSNGAIVEQAHRVVSSIVRWEKPTEAELTAYIASGEPLQVAGAFTLERLGGWFIAGVNGDPTSITGISLPATRHLLAEVGISVVDLWCNQQ